MDGFGLPFLRFVIVYSLNKKERSPFPPLRGFGITIHPPGVGMSDFPYVFERDIKATLGDEKYMLFDKLFGAGHTCPVIIEKGVQVLAVWPWDAEGVLRRMANHSLI